jgi:DHA1 family bicyclomycin/chloramphenicol resistance-like MFS transporter
MSQENQSPEMQTPIRERPLLRQPLLWYVLGIGVFAGAVQNILLITFPVFRRVFLADLEALGLMQTIVFSSALALSIISGWLTLKVGLLRAVLLNLLLLAAALGAIGSAPSFALVLILSSCVGFCIAGMDVFSNALIADVFYERRQTVYFLSGVSIAVGYAIGSAAIGKWLRDTEQVAWGWRSCYWTIAIIVGVFAVSGWLLPASGIAQARSNVGSSVALAAAEVKTIMRRPAIYIVGIAMFLHGLAQVGIVSWVGLLFQSRLSVDTAQAAYLLSANAVGFFLGRMLLSWITARWRIPDLVLLAFCSGAGTLSYVGTLAAPTYLLGLTLFFVSGMIVCGNGPCMFSYLGSRFQEEHASAFGLLGVFGYVGSSVGPLIIGVIGTRIGIEKGVWCIPVFSLLLFLLAVFGHMAELRRRQTVQTCTPLLPTH